MMKVILSVNKTKPLYLDSLIFGFTCLGLHWYTCIPLVPFNVPRILYTLRRIDQSYCASLILFIKLRINDVQLNTLLKSWLEIVQPVSFEVVI